MEAIHIERNVNRLDTTVRGKSSYEAVVGWLCTFKTVILNFGILYNISYLIK